MAALGAAPQSRLVADLKAGVTELRRRLPGKKVAATGFCFGGGMTWLLLASREARLGGCGAVLRPLSRRRQPERCEGCRARDLRAARLARERIASGCASRAAQGRACGIRSSPTRMSTTRSSTRRARATTRRQPQRPTGACSTGSASTSQRPDCPSRRVTRKPATCGIEPRNPRTRYVDTQHPDAILGASMLVATRYTASPLVGIARPRCDTSAASAVHGVVRRRRPVEPSGAARAG